MEQYEIVLQQMGFKLLGKKPMDAKEVPEETPVLKSKPAVGDDGMPKEMSQEQVDSLSDDQLAATMKGTHQYTAGSDGIPDRYFQKRKDDFYPNVTQLPETSQAERKLEMKDIYLAVIGKSAEGKKLLPEERKRLKAALNKMLKEDQ